MSERSKLGAAAFARESPYRRFGPEHGAVRGHERRDPVHQRRRPSALGDAGLSGRSLFIGVELRPAERRRLRERLRDAGDELSATIAGALAARGATSDNADPE